ncbi:MAG: BrnT family toxin [Phycisphaerales bacterium]|jgi:uncharacterized DUF497 family protein|nr:BrnT family toxin [Phycisphaerales bacterium]
MTRRPDFPDGFEWSNAKAIANYGKHGVSFEEAATAFQDPNQLVAFDRADDAGEDRFVLIGLTRISNLLAVVHVERRERIRIISARRATRGESVDYATKLKDER